MEHLKTCYRASERRACTVLEIGRTTHRYEGHKEEWTELRMRMREIAQYHRLRADLAAVGLAESVYLHLDVADEPVSVEDLPHQNQGSPGFLAEDAGRVERAIGELPEKERMVLRLSYFASMELTEIAQRMGYQKSYISKLRKRGIEHLAVILRTAPTHPERRGGRSADRYCRPSLERAHGKRSESSDSVR